MSKLEWNDILNLGVKQIDDQHRRLLQLANNLIAAVQRGEEQDIMDIFFKELREDTVFHFREKELYMDEIEYPERGKHAALHQALKGQVKQYQRDMHENKEISADEVLNFMRGWLVDHILYQDMKIAKYLEENKPMNPVSVGD